MTAQIPKVQVYLKKSAPSPGNGEAGRVAVIGAFNSEVTSPQLFTNLEDAQTALGTDTSFNGVACLPYIFRGATNVLAVNTTTWTGSGSNKTADKELTTAKLSEALAKIKGENWDILFIAEPLSDAFIVIVDQFLIDCFEMKYPAGFIGALNGANDAANITTAGKAGEHCYGLLTQQLTVDGVDLSVLLSAAYYTGVVAGMTVGNTMTMKTVPYVTGVNPELSFETGGAGKSLVEAGITTVKCQDRGAGNYIVVNSEQPNGFDLYVNRVRDYVVKAMSLHQFLGERNRNATLNEIKHELDRVKNECVNVLDLLRDIEFTVTKKSANCVDIYIKRLLFDGIITEINVYVTVEVE